MEKLVQSQWDKYEARLACVLKLEKLTDSPRGYTPRFRIGLCSEIGELTDSPRGYTPQISN